MNSTRSTSHEALQSYFIYSAILLLIVLGGYFAWSHYRSGQERKRRPKGHPDSASRATKSHGRQRHKKHKK